MTSPIKPPGGPPPGSPIEGTPGTSGPGRSGEAGEAFRQQLDQTRGAMGAERTVPAAETDPVRAIANDLREGRIDAATAVDRLVARALDGGAAQGLPPARRAELEDFLRRTLADDPTLAVLTKDLERGA